MSNNSKRTVIQLQSTSEEAKADVLALMNKAGLTARHLPARPGTITHTSGNTYDVTLNECFTSETLTVEFTGMGGYYTDSGLAAVREFLGLSESQPEQLTLVAYELQYLTTTTPDYFQGSELPVVQVLVDEDTTYEDVKTRLLEYIATCHLPDLDQKLYKAAVATLMEEVYSKTQPYTIPTQLQGVGSMFNEDEDAWDLYLIFNLKEIYADPRTA